MAIPWQAFTRGNLGTMTAPQQRIGELSAMWGQQPRSDAQNQELMGLLQSRQQAKWGGATESPYETEKRLLREREAAQKAERDRRQAEIMDQAQEMQNTGEIGSIFANDDRQMAQGIAANLKNLQGADALVNLRPGRATSMANFEGNASGNTPFTMNMANPERKQVYNTSQQYKTDPWLGARQYRYNTAQGNNPWKYFS